MIVYWIAFIAIPPLVFFGHLNNNEKVSSMPVLSIWTAIWCIAITLLAL